MHVLILLLQTVHFSIIDVYPITFSGSGRQALFWPHPLLGKNVLTMIAGGHEWGCDDNDNASASVCSNRAVQHHKHTHNSNYTLISVCLCLCLSIAHLSSPLSPWHYSFFIFIHLSVSLHQSIYFLEFYYKHSPWWWTTFISIKCPFKLIFL